MRPTECTGLKPALAGVTRSNIASAPSATVATRILIAGLGGRQRRGEHQARVRGAGLPDGQRK